MKKFRNCLTAFLLLLVLPLVFLLTACGATPSNEVKGVFFDTQIYDDGEAGTGYAVFEVDFNRETELTYKVNPSSWSGYTPVYQTLRSGENEQNRTRFELKDGKITITDRAFEPITVQISVNDYKDICIIRLKQYPTDIFLKDSAGNPVKEYDVPLNAKGSYSIHVFGEFKVGDVTEIRELKDNVYKFNVVSSDSTVIQVKNKERLSVNTLKLKPESATVTVNLLNANGDFVGSTLKVNFVVTPLVGQAFVDIDGYDKYITDENKDIVVEINASSLETEGNGTDLVYIMNYDIDLYSSTGVYIEKDEYSVEVISSLQRYVSVENNQIKIKTSSNLDFKLTFWTGLNSDAGTPYFISFNVKFIL